MDKEKMQDIRKAVEGMSDEEEEGIFLRSNPGFVRCHADQRGLPYHF